MMVVSSTTMSWALAMMTRIHQCARVGASARPVDGLTASTLVTWQSVGQPLDLPSGPRPGIWGSSRTLMARTRPLCQCVTDLLFEYT